MSESEGCDEALFDESTSLKALILSTAKHLNPFPKTEYVVNLYPLVMGRESYFVLPSYLYPSPGKHQIRNMEFDISEKLVSFTRFTENDGYVGQTSPVLSIPGDGLVIQPGIILLPLGVFYFELDSNVFLPSVLTATELSAKEYLENADTILGFISSVLADDISKQDI